MDIAGLLNSAVRNSIPENAVLFATSSGDDRSPGVEHGAIQGPRSSVADSWYQTTWYNDEGQLISQVPHRDESGNWPPFYGYPEPPGPILDAQQPQQLVSDQTHNTWQHSPRVREESIDPSLIRRKLAVTMNMGATRMPHSCNSLSPQPVIW